MTSPQRRKGRTRFIATGGVREYRATIDEWVRPEDAVLEIGCEWGTTSVLLAPRCQSLIATDLSPDCIARARDTHPGIRFEVLDGFDVRAALEFGVDFSKIYIDISGLSGYRALLDGVALLNSYATVFRPEAIIIKSGSLKSFLSRCSVPGTS